MAIRKATETAVFDIALFGKANAALGAAEAAGSALLTREGSLANRLGSQSAFALVGFGQKSAGRAFLAFDPGIATGMAISDAKQTCSELFEI